MSDDFISVGNVTLIFFSYFRKSESLNIKAIPLIA